MKDLEDFLWGLRAPEDGAGAETAEGEDTSVARTAEPHAPADPPEGPSDTPEDGEAPAPAEAKPTISLETFQKRIGAMARRAGDAERQAAAERAAREALEASIRAASGEEGEKPAAPAARTGRTYTETEALALADQAAAHRAFTEKCNEVATRGREKYKGEFDQSLNMINSGIGQMTNEFLEAVLETGMPEDVIHALGKDLDRTSSIMALSPARQGVALAKLASEIAGKKPPATKKVSDAPEPITPKVGSPKGKGEASLDNDNMDIKEWMALRDKQLREQRR